MLCHRQTSSFLQHIFIINELSHIIKHKKYRQTPFSGNMLPLQIYFFDVIHLKKLPLTAGFFKC